MARLLIIDDDPNTLKLLRARLEKSGHQVLSAADGEAGVRMAQAERPELVFLDVRMPKLDGWQVCRQLKGNPLTVCPVIMLTGCSQDVQELYGLQCGADEYVTKPWDARQLLELAERLLAQAAAATEAASSAAQIRLKQHVQRIVQLSGELAKKPEVQAIATQLCARATTLLAKYQTVVTSPQRAAVHEQMTQLVEQAGELRYWLDLLRDSQMTDSPELPRLIAETQVIAESFRRAARNPAA